MEAADVVVTIGRGDACPVFPRKRYLDWSCRISPGRPWLSTRIGDETGRRVDAARDAPSGDRAGGSSSMIEMGSTTLVRTIKVLQPDR
ncbi:MAG: hypothetical protein ACXVWF_08525, partial [Actinomycetota bacterium]